MNKSHRTSLSSRRVYCTSSYYCYSKILKTVLYSHFITISFWYIFISELYTQNLLSGILTCIKNIWFINVFYMLLWYTKFVYKKHTHIWSIDLKWIIKQIYKFDTLHQTDVYILWREGRITTTCCSHRQHFLCYFIYGWGETHLCTRVSGASL